MLKSDGKDGRLVDGGKNGHKDGGEDGSDVNSENRKSLTILNPNTTLNYGGVCCKAKM